MGSVPSPQPQLLNLEQLCQQLNVSPSWVYKRTWKGAPDPLPVIRGIGHLKFDPELVRRTRPDILLKHYPHVLDESAEFAAQTLSSQLSG